MPSTLTFPGLQMLNVESPSGRNSIPRNIPGDGGGGV